ncbi:sensor domain-containing diguanylate cyclase [Shewanella litorisediminis]|uniref:Sensor domain-containing diguanylate cyclase n=1 Tax=Shewanella litorisediminis TaxID=1173586 RepID=A0ABX7FYX4_9GAMM|nr:sensor domain-containing diguanylate cyclase [Shewanella litorisediminis]MCL2918793.1 sensor domain-containing diguanylate cyclase [Shewanella litorisediminis]QRH00237.1 sensor domain-containing diguanylate cyclase [Shewanella litorisediminis]
MLKASIPVDETERLNALYRLEILDTKTEERFDRITRLARRLFDVPICLISLVDKDRQWFKSCVGLDACQTARDISFCSHTILQSDIFVVEDTFEDPRFVDNPLVTETPHIRFYAGYPLTLSNGFRVGTLCILDTRPRHFDEESLKDLQDLGQMVVSELESHQTATLDPLTGLSNLRGFERLGRQCLLKCERYQQDATLMFFDLDHFKDINDRFGHQEGNEALKAFAGLLLESFREYDVVARLGGDEFAAVISHDKMLSPAIGIIHRLRQTLAAHNISRAIGYQIEFSCGCARFDGQSPLELDVLLKQADTQMYREKQHKQRND